MNVCVTAVGMDVSCHPLGLNTGVIAGLDGSYMLTYLYRNSFLFICVSVRRSWNH